MTTQEFLKIAMELVSARGHSDSVQVVWFNYTLGNMKGLFINLGIDPMYYEVTYNKATNQIYVDAYKKVGKEVYNVPSKKDLSIN